MIYFLQHSKTGLVKIGCTHSLKTRMQYLSNQYGELNLLGLMDGFENEETELHNQFVDHNVTGILEGREWFNPDKSIVDYIEKYTELTIPLPIANRDSKRYTKRKKQDDTEWTMVRVSDSTKQAMRIIQAKVMIETGERLSMDKLLNRILEKAFPDDAKKEGIDTEKEIEERKK